MRITTTYAFLVLLLSCGNVDPSTNASMPADGHVSRPVDAQQSCDPMAKFDTPIPVPGLEMIDGGPPRLSPDELTIYFFTGAPTDLWTARRSALTEAFGTPTTMTAQNSPYDDADPTTTPDGLTLWFTSNRVINEGYHMYVAARPSGLAVFGAPGLAATVNATDTKQWDIQPSITSDNNELWFASSRSGGMGSFDIWHAIWSGSGFGTPTAVSEINSSADDRMPTLSADQLTIYFSSTRATIGTKGAADIWTSHRNSIHDKFSPPTLVNELNTSGGDYAKWMSADNCRIYGLSYVNGPGRYFVAARQPQM